MREQIKISGGVQIFLRTPGEESRLVFEKHNLVVNTGLNILRSGIVQGSPLYAGDANVYPNVTAFGTGTTAPVAGNTALETPLNAAGAGNTSFKALTDLQFPTGTGKVKCITLYGTGDNNNSGMTEAGLFAGSLGAGDPPVISGLVLIARVNGLSISKTPSNELQIEWTLTFAAS